MTSNSENTGLIRAKRKIQSLLPHVEIECIPLPEVPEIRLWLLGDLHPELPLDGETVNALMEAPPYWSLCWASGQVLARFLLDYPERVRGKVVVDVGPGSGVVAIAAAMAGAERVIACDLDELALNACTLNAEANQVAIQTSKDLGACLEEADLVVAADILYDRENLVLLDQFRNARGVLLADSRIPDLNPAGYDRIAQMQATTWPDLDESREFNQVRLFAAGEQAQTSLGSGMRPGG